MLIKSNCRLRIINGPSEKLELSGFATEGLVWPKLEAKITECPLWIFDIWLSICSRTKYAIIKKIEGDAIFSRSFWNFEKSKTFWFIIVVENHLIKVTELCNTFTMRYQPVFYVK